MNELEKLQRRAARLSALIEKTEKAEALNYQKGLRLFMKVGRLRKMAVCLRRRLENATAAVGLLVRRTKRQAKGAAAAGELPNGSRA